MKQALTLIVPRTIYLCECVKDQLSKRDITVLVDPDCAVTPTLNLQIENSTFAEGLSDSAIARDPGAFLAWVMTTVAELQRRAEQSGGSEPNFASQVKALRDKTGDGAMPVDELAEDKT